MLIGFSTNYHRPIIMLQPNLHVLGWVGLDWVQEKYTCYQATTQNWSKHFRHTL